jgi:hypothetical protein
MACCGLAQIGWVTATHFDDLILSHDVSRTLVYGPVTARTGLMSPPEERTELQVESLPRASCFQILSVTSLSLSLSLSPRS